MRLFIRVVVLFLSVWSVPLPTALAAPLRMLQFIASDFRTAADNPTDYRSIGDPFGIFGLPQPLSITGAVVFDPEASPLLGPFTRHPGDPLRENSSVWLPYESLTFELGPGVVLSALNRRLDDSLRVVDGVGTDVSDGLAIEATASQTLPSGIKIHSMAIQLFGPSSLFSGLAVPSTDVYTAMAASMPSYDEKLSIVMLDSRDRPHILRAFHIVFSDARPVPAPSAGTLAGLALATLAALRPWSDAVRPRFSGRILHPRATLDHPARFGEDLGRDIERFGSLWAERAQRRLADYFPVHAHERIFAYLLGNPRCAA